MDLNETGRDEPCSPHAGLHMPLLLADGGGIAAPAQPPRDGDAATAREWMAVARRLGLRAEEMLLVARSARVNRSGFAGELLASGKAAEDAIFRAIADELGLPFLSTIDPDRLLLGDSHRERALASSCNPPITMLEADNDGVVYVLARFDIDIASMRAHLARRPGLAGRLLVAPPSALRAAIVARARERLILDAQNGLFLAMPEFSARETMSGRQGLYLGMLAAAFPVALHLEPRATVLALVALSVTAFLSCIVLRMMALATLRPPEPPRTPVPPVGDLPVYSVLVALYRESEMAPQLVAALRRLRWPAGRLEIKLVCEEDDHETLDALRSHRLHPCFEIVLVPGGGPRTKPKALAYALPLCSGEFVALYDAEDRPHPMQLVAAWRRFREEETDLACLQAPIIVTNAASGPLARMFAFEYAGLFRGLLPFLARAGLVLPLGGTSNHFRRGALIEVGGWDAHNVTEDADLGIRLKRFGYRTGTIGHPTFEDGPEEFAAWLPQRTRWFKGWLQTWLVHMRNPAALWRDLGPASFVTAQILFAGAIISALVHPFFVCWIAYTLAKLAMTDTAGGREAIMAAMGLVSIVSGYAAFITLSQAALSPPEKGSLVRTILLTPAHWFMLSLAAWLALWELYRRPYHWNKTPHRRRPGRTGKSAVSSMPKTARR